MDTNRSFETWQSLNDPLMPSAMPPVVPLGVEVDSVVVIEPGPLTAAGKVTQKLNELKSRATGAVDSAKRTLQEKVDGVKPIVSARVNSVRDQIDQKVVTMRNQVEAKATMLRNDVETRVGVLKTKAETEMTHLRDDVRTNPMKWAGISAGAGIGIGLVGRWMHHRTKVRAREVPQIVIIEAAC